MFDAIKAGAMTNEERFVSFNRISRKLDVLVGLISKTQLNKENQYTLLSKAKELTTDSKTRKKAYKLMAEIIKKFEFSSLSELQ